MKLELKYITPYLSYGLKARFMHPVVEHQKDGVITSIYNIDDDIKFSIDNYDDEHIWMFKPILRPLSDLTDSEVKILFHHKADNGVTVSRYESSLSTEITITATYKIMGDVFTDFVICRNGVDNVDYWIVEILLSNHFDVFGLIEAGLAIDKNTIS